MHGMEDRSWSEASSRATTRATGCHGRMWAAATRLREWRGDDHRRAREACLSPRRCARCCRGAHGDHRRCMGLGRAVGHWTIEVRGRLGVVAGVRSSTCRVEPGRRRTCGMRSRTYGLSEDHASGRDASGKSASLSPPPRPGANALLAKHSGVSVPVRGGRGSGGRKG
jgi:hypothetical protein